MKALASKLPNMELYIHEKTRCSCRVEQIPVELDPGNELLLVIHYDDRRKVVWFAILLNRVENARGREIYSVDTGHGYFHEHTSGHQKPNDRKDLEPLYSQVSVQESYDVGYELVMRKYSAVTGR